MTAASWSYPPELAEALERFGFRPRPDTPPALVREALHDQYRYQLRRVRDDLRAGRVARPAYLDRVVALRKRYWPLTLPLPAWERICIDDSAMSDR
jgi:hypothetical protein